MDVCCVVLWCRFVVVDSKGATSPSLQIQIVQCSGCSGHGTCNFEEIRPQTTVDEFFQEAVCDCEPYYSGECHCTCLPHCLSLPASDSVCLLLCLCACLSVSHSTLCMGAVAFTVSLSVSVSVSLSACLSVCLYFLPRLRISYTRIHTRARAHTHTHTHSPHPHPPPYPTSPTPHPPHNCPQ